MRKLKWIGIIGGATTLILVAVTALILFVAFPKSPIALTEPKLVKVEAGWGFNQLCRHLARTDVIARCGPLKWYSKFSPDLRAIKTGLYQVEPAISHLALLQLFSKGREHQFSVTLVEGETFKQWMQRLSGIEQLQHRDWTEAELIEKLGSPHGKLEGLLYADTYHFTAGSDSYALIERAYRTMAEKLETAWHNRQPDLPLKTPYEALILASIIEKETGAAFERPMIASVFVNRLNKKMRLQTDPTVIYGLGDAFDGNLTRAHLRQKTIYNTYRINGLPPTPIAMPGLASIEAALNPLTTDFIYFVSKKDGTHQFSKTLQDHNRAVRQYQLGKAPK